MAVSTNRGYREQTPGSKDPGDHIKETQGMRPTHLLPADRFLTPLRQILDGPRIVPQIHLATDQKDGNLLTEVEDLGDPLLLYVVQGIGRVDTEADEDDVGIRV